MDYDGTKPEERDQPGIGLRSSKKPNILVAMAAYAALAILAAITLNGPSAFEFRLRVLVWLVLCGASGTDVGAPNERAAVMNPV
jgi:hypothetical protein